MEIRGSSWGRAQGVHCTKITGILRKKVPESTPGNDLCSQGKANSGIRTESLEPQTTMVIFSGGSRGGAPLIFGKKRRND